MAEAEHIKAKSYKDTMKDVDANSPLANNHTTAPQTSPVPDGANPEQAKSNANQAWNTTKEIANDTLNWIGEKAGFDEPTKKFWDQGCHGKPSNFLEAILAIIARLFDGFKSIDPNNFWDSLTGQNDPNSVKSLMADREAGRLTIGETKTFVGPDNKVYKYDTISRSCNTPTWVQMTSDGKEIQSVIMQESGYFAVYDYDQESGNYKKTSLDVSTQLARDLAKGNPPPNFKQTTYQEFWKTYKDKITEKLNGLILYGKTDHVVKDEYGNAVSPAKFYRNQLDNVMKTFVDAVSDEKTGQFDRDETIKNIRDNAISFDKNGQIYILVDGVKNPVDERYFAKMFPDLDRAMISLKKDIAANGGLYLDEERKINVVSYEGQSHNIDSFDTIDLYNIQYANKHKDVGLQERGFNRQLAEVKGLLKETYGMSNKEVDAMVKDVLVKQPTPDAFGSQGMGLAFEKGRAFYVTYQELSEKINEGKANKDEVQAYDEMKQFLSNINIKKPMFENQIGLKLIFSNPDHTIRDYLGEGKIKITEKTVTNEHLMNKATEYILNNKADQKDNNSLTTGILNASVNISNEITAMQMKSHVLGDSYTVTVAKKDLPFLNYLLQPGNERELGEFVARISDSHLDTKDLVKFVENMKIIAKENEWSLKEGDTISFRKKGDDNGYLIIFGANDDNGVVVDTNKGIDGEKLKEHAERLAKQEAEIANKQMGSTSHNFSM